jgi:hypothetical protein
MEGMLLANNSAYRLLGVVENGERENKLSGMMVTIVDMRFIKNFHQRNHAIP